MVSYDGEELTKGSWTPEVSLLGPGRALLSLGWPAASPLLTCAVACLLPCLQEDESLRKQVARLGPRNWSLIAKAIPGRSGKSCRLRWVCRPTTDCGSRLRGVPMRPAGSILLLFRTFCFFQPSDWATLSPIGLVYGAGLSVAKYRCWLHQQKISICLLHLER